MICIFNNEGKYYFPIYWVMKKSDKKMTLVKKLYYR